MVTRLAAAISSLTTPVWVPAVWIVNVEPAIELIVPETEPRGWAEAEA